MNNRAVFQYKGCPVMGPEKGDVTNTSYIWIYSDEDPVVIGGPYTEFYKFNDFLMQTYVTTDGIAVKNTVLENGDKVSVRWDLVRCIYECFVYSSCGKLKKAEKYYLDSDLCEESVRLPDGNVKVSIYNSLVKPVFSL